MKYHQLAVLSVLFLCLLSCTADHDHEILTNNLKQISIIVDSPMPPSKDKKEDIINFLREDFGVYSNSQAILNDSIKIDYFLFDELLVSHSSGQDLLSSIIKSSTSSGDLLGRINLLSKNRGHDSLLVLYTTFLGKKIDQVDVNSAINPRFHNDVQIDCYGNDMYRITMGNLNHLKYLPNHEKALVKRNETNIGLDFCVDKGYKGDKNIFVNGDNLIEIDDINSSEVALGALVNLEKDTKSSNLRVRVYKNGSVVPSNGSVVTTSEIVGNADLYSTDSDKVAKANQYSHMIQLSIDLKNLDFSRADRSEQIHIVVFESKDFTHTSGYLNCIGSNTYMPMLSKHLWSRIVPEEMRSDTIKIHLIKPLKIVT